MTRVFLLMAVLQGAAALVVVDLLGGSITDFYLQGQDTNPLDWGRERVGNGPGSMGHFLCLDRWASVSEAEAKNGMPGHGEATAVVWRVVRGPEERDGFITAEMTAELPLAGLAVRRVIRLDNDRAFFYRARRGRKYRQARAGSRRSAGRGSSREGYYILFDDALDVVDPRHFDQFERLG